VCATEGGKKTKKQRAGTGKLGGGRWGGGSNIGIKTVTKKERKVYLQRVGMLPKKKLGERGTFGWVVKERTINRWEPAPTTGWCTHNVTSKRGRSKWV